MSLLTRGKCQSDAGWRACYCRMNNVTLVESRLACQRYKGNGRPGPRHRRRKTARPSPNPCALAANCSRQRERSGVVVPGVVAAAILMGFYPPLCRASAGSSASLRPLGGSDAPRGGSTSTVAAAGYSLPVSGVGSGRADDIAATAAALAAAAATGGDDGGESTTTADGCTSAEEHSDQFSEEGGSKNSKNCLTWDQEGAEGERQKELSRRRFRQDQQGFGGGDGRLWRHEDLEQLLQELEDTEYGGMTGAGTEGERPRGGRKRAKARFRGPRSARFVPGAAVGSEGGDSGADGGRWQARPGERGQQPNEGFPYERGETLEGSRGVSGQGMDVDLSPPFTTSSTAPPNKTASASATAAATGYWYSFWSAKGVPSTCAERVPVGGDEAGASNEDREASDSPSPTPCTGYEEGHDGGLSSSPVLQLLSGDLSDTGSAGAGAWTDADTEDFSGNANGGSEDRLAAYGYPPPHLQQAVGVGGAGGTPKALPKRVTTYHRPLLTPYTSELSSSSARGRARATLDLDYSAKVLDYGRKSGVGPPKGLTFRSWSRLSGAACIAAAGAFLAVSPNNAPRDDYLALFRRNLGLLAASLVGPATYSFLSYDGTKANLNTYVRVVTFAFTWGYVVALALEVVVATVFQLLTLALLEPAAFKLTPHVPAIFLPWVLRENGYTPSYLYTCVADLLSFCVGAPIVECGVIAWVVRRSGALPERVAPAHTNAAAAAAGLVPAATTPPTRGNFGSGTLGGGNFDAASLGEGDRLAVSEAGVLAETGVKSSRQRRAKAEGDKGIAEAEKVARTSVAAAAAATLEAAQEPTHVHTYLLYVLGSAMGLKAACTMQRVLVYTKEYHHHKAFFAFARGFFPLYELCGSIIAMSLARRDILGERMNRLQLFFVAVSLNAYGIFRGTKPIFKWASSKPWDELMVKAWVFPKGMTAFQRVSKGFASVAWSLVVLKVTAHVIKTYWRLKRLHSARLRHQHEMAAAAAAAAERRAAALQQALP